MPSYNPPKKNTEYIFYVSLSSQANGNTFQSSPTIAAGDWKVSIDGGALANLTTLPTVTPAAGKLVKVTLSTSEMNGDNIMVVGSDAAGAEWRDIVINIQTTTQQFDDLATQASVNIIDDFLDTEIAAIKAKTDGLPSDPADASDIAASFSTVNTKLDTIDDFLDTEIAAIKAKTDNLPTDPADASDIAGAFTTVNTKLDTIDDFLDTEIAAIKAKTDNLPTDPADASDIAALFGALNNVSVANILAGVIEGSLTLKDVLRLILAANAGKSSGGGTTTVTFRDNADTKNRISATVNSSGNRTAVTLDAS